MTTVSMNVSGQRPTCHLSDSTAQGKAGCISRLPINSLTIHPFAAFFPEIAGGRLLEFIDDLSRNGLIEPIVVDPRNRVIDGRNRLKAWQGLGHGLIDARIVDLSDDEILPYILSLNMFRRHLDESQRAMIAARIRNAAPIGAITDGQAAANMNVSERSVERAKKVLRDGAPELSEAVERGQIPVSAAADLARLSREDQQRIVAEGPEAAKDAAKEIRDNAEPASEPSRKLPRQPKDDPDPEQICGKLTKQYNELPEEVRRRFIIGLIEEYDEIFDWIEEWEFPDDPPD